ncbi:translation initiation factor IF-2 [Candidatus Woesearchaeota archaeon]|nr:translation initiation factor IF-2 [Candidatus Woesearchaeota archaeon]
MIGTLRKPIVTILGHVDHGKTKLLDAIRKTTVVDREAGAITQAIGASLVPLETIQRVCGDLLKKLNLKFTIPGLLFIDTPGHAAFANLRKRGGNLADIAIVVVDINEGFMPQTLEAIEILKKYKTPFVVAVNKIDLINGWKIESRNLLEDINKQQQHTVAAFETKFYEVVGKLYELGFQADRFDRVSDYAKQIAMIPISAKQNHGLAELLMVVSGLTQRYLNENLKYDITSPAKGIILEVKEELGLGKTIDVIIYDGSIEVNDTIIIGAIDAPIITKVRALFEPQPLQEMRDKKSKFLSVKKAAAATGVKISAPELDNAVAGMPLRVCRANGKEDNEEIKQKIIEEIKSEIDEVLIETDKDGIIIKADTLGSLEALTYLLKEKKIQIRKATIGEITRKDITEAETNKEVSPLFTVILGFNTRISPDAEEYASKSPVKIFNHAVIYKLLEDFDKWLEQEKKNLEKQELTKITAPCKARIMPNHIFRQNNPAIVGMDILTGTLRVNMPLMKEKAANTELEGKSITFVKSMKQDKDAVQEAKAGTQLAVALEDVTVGRQIFENDILYSAMNEDDFRKLKEHKKHLKKDELETMKEIALIMRKKNPLWGI